ncbi:MAG TPA: secretion system protein E, partial [Chromatiales bacterium]|nr:secretion system protein E [Chromatiales bacterium]
MSAVPRPRRLGDLLVEKGLLTQDQLQVALTEQKRRGLKLGQVVVALGFVTEAIMRDVLGEALGQESVDLSKMVLDSDLLKLIPRDVARRYRILPLSLDRARRRLTVAMADTFNVVAIDQLAAQVGEGIHIQPVLAAESEI